MTTQEQIRIQMVNIRIRKRKCVRIYLQVLLLLGNILRNSKQILSPNTRLRSHSRPRLLNDVGDMNERVGSEDREDR